MSTNCLLICLLINNYNISFSGISRSLGPLAYLDGEIIVKRFIYGTQVNIKSETIPHSDVKFIFCETGRSFMIVYMPKHESLQSSNLCDRGYILKWVMLHDSCIKVGGHISN